MNRPWRLLAMGLSVLVIWALSHRWHGEGMAHPEGLGEVPAGGPPATSGPISGTSPASGSLGDVVASSPERVRGAAADPPAPKAAPLLVGFARDLAGQRLPGVTLCLTDRREEVGRSVTGAAGEFRMNAAPGTFSCPETDWAVIGYREAGGESVSGGSDASWVVEVCLARSIGFTGQVLDERGEPLPWQPRAVLDSLDARGGFIQRASQEPHFENWIGDRPARIRLDTEGRFRVEKAAVWRGRKLRFLDPNFGVLALDMPHVDGANLSLTFPGVPEERPLHVKVMAAPGLPAGDGGVHHGPRWHWADDAGLVRLRIHPEDRSKPLLATRPGYLDAPIRVPHISALSRDTPRTVEVFVDRPAPELSGVVLDPGGAPVPGAFVVIERRASLRRMDPSPGPSAYSSRPLRPGLVTVTAGANGEFRVPCPFLGPASCWAARAEGRAFGAPVHVSVASGLAGLAPRVPGSARARTIHGRVQRPSGEPMPGIFVSPTLALEGVETTINRMLSSDAVDDRPVGGRAKTNPVGFFSLPLNQDFVDPRWRLVSPEAEYVVRAESGGGTPKDPLILVLRGPRRVLLSANASQAGRTLSFLGARGERVPFNVDVGLPPAFIMFSMRIVGGSPFEADVPWHATHAVLTGSGGAARRLRLRGAPGVVEALEF